MQTPTQLSEILMRKSAEFGQLSDSLARILEKKADIWVAMREDHKSDTATDRAWQATELGKEETKTKLKLKALEKEMSAIRTHLNVLSDEARNMY